MMLLCTMCAFCKTPTQRKFQCPAPLFFDGTFVEQTFEGFIANRQKFFTINSVRSFYGFGSRSYKEFLRRAITRRRRMACLFWKISVLWHFSVQQILFFRTAAFSKSRGRKKRVRGVAF